MREGGCGEFIPEFNGGEGGAASLGDTFDLFSDGNGFVRQILSPEPNVRRTIGLNPRRISYCTAA